MDNLTLELPRETLLQGEIVTELKGEVRGRFTDLKGGKGEIVS